MGERLLRELRCPDSDKAARTIAENAYSAFAGMATTPAEPLAEQTVLTRLVEAIRPQASSGSMQAIVDAANGALDAWERRDGDLRGRRVEAIDSRDGTVTMRLDRRARNNA